MDRFLLVIFDRGAQKRNAMLIFSTSRGGRGERTCTSRPLAIRLLPDRHLPSSGLFWLTLCCLAKFCGRELALGQANVVFGALLLGSLGALGLALPGVTGLCVAAACCIKLYGVLFVPWLAVTGGRRAMAMCLAVVSVGVTFPTLMYGWSGNLELCADWYYTVTSSTAPNLLVSDHISLASM